MLASGCYEQYCKPLLPTDSQPLKNTSLLARAKTYSMSRILHVRPLLDRAGELRGYGPELVHDHVYPLPHFRCLC